MTSDPTIGKDGKSYPLTPKQEAFVAAYLETGNGSESYRRAYSTKGWPDEAIRVAASKQLDNPKIAKALADRRKQEAANVSVTVESLVAELDEIKAVALADPKGSSAAVSAVLGKAKLLGFMVDKVDQTVRQADPSDHKPDLSNLRRKAALSDNPVTHDAALDPSTPGPQDLTH